MIDLQHNKDVAAQVEQKLKTIINRQVAFQKERMVNETNKMFNGLVSGYQFNKLPERIFVNDFLPFFCGEKQIENYEDIYKLWFGIAGSPTAEVSIINNDGELLFNVPPIVDSHVFNPEYNKNKEMPSIADIDGMSEALERSIPIRGMTFRAEAFTDRVFRLTSAGYKHTEHEKRWLDIFIKYKKISISNNNTQINTKPTDSIELSDEADPDF